MTQVFVRITGRQYGELREHLYPGDGKEAVAVLLAGRRSDSERHVLCVRELVLVPHNECFDRSEDEVRWPTTRLQERLPDAAKKNLAVIKMHSHPGGFASFSMRDDGADRELFESIFGWMETRDPHASLVMLPCGRLFGRAAFEGGKFQDLRSIAVAGDELKFWFDGEAELPVSEAFRRNEQAFGRGTISLLRRLRVGVVGVTVHGPVR